MPVPLNVKALWVGYPDRARADAQKTLGEFFGNMPVDRKIEDRSLRRDRREVADEASHSNCDGLNAVLFAPSEQGLFHRTVCEFMPSFQHAARMRPHIHRPSW